MIIIMKKIDKLLFIMNIICKHKNTTLLEELKKHNCSMSVNNFNKTGVEVWYYYNKLNDIGIISFSKLLDIKNLLISIKNIPNYPSINKICCNLIF